MSCIYTRMFYLPAKETHLRLSMEEDLAVSATREVGFAGSEPGLLVFREIGFNREKSPPALAWLTQPLPWTQSHRDNR